MAQTLARTAAANVVNREDLGDLISNISRSETPVLSAAKTLTATNTYHEWLTDSLAPPSNTPVAEGAGAGTVGDLHTQERLGNYTQINKVVYGVSNTMEASNSAGFDSAIAYAAAKAARELKTNVDYAICAGDSVAAHGSGTRTSASLNAWITNSSREGGGADPVGGDGTATDTQSGTTRFFDEGMLTDVIEQCWDDGGKPSLIVAGPKQRGVFSTFDGLNNGPQASISRSDRASRTIMGTAEVYVSNYGTLSVVASRHIRKKANIDTDVWLIDPENLGVAYLRPWQEQELAVTGDGRDRMLTVEWTLQMTNPEAHGQVADLK